MKKTKTQVTEKSQKLQEDRKATFGKLFQDIAIEKERREKEIVKRHTFRERFVY